MINKARNSRTPTSSRSIKDTYHLVAEKVASEPVRVAQVALTGMFVGGALLVGTMRYFFGVSSLVTVPILIVLSPLIFLLVGRILRRTNSELQSQRLFVSNIAHELRGQLATMESNTELALYQVQDETRPNIKDAKKLLSHIKEDLEGLRQMSNIIKNLALLSSDQFATKKTDSTKVNLSELLERLSRVVEKSHAVEKDIRIEVHASSQPVFVNANGSQLEQIIVNLLTNAVRYSPAKTTVSTAAVISDDGVTLSVADEGIGMSESELALVFNPYYRAERSSERGSGLGLAIVAALAKRNQAKIQIQSVLHKGTKVALHFPAEHKLA